MGDVDIDYTEAVFDSPIDVGRDVFILEELAFEFEEKGGGVLR